MSVHVLMFFTAGRNGLICAVTFPTFHFSNFESFEKLLKVLKNYVGILFLQGRYGGIGLQLPEDFLVKILLPKAQIPSQIWKSGFLSIFWSEKMHVLKDFYCQSILGAYRVSVQQFLHSLPSAVLDLNLCLGSFFRFPFLNLYFKFLCF